MGKRSIKNHVYLLIIIILSIFGCFFIAWVMRNGPWGWSDSVAYLVSARNLIKGIGIGYYFPDGRFNTNITQPPFYLIVIGLIGFLQVDLIEGVRFLNILLFGGTIFLIGLIFYLYSDYPWLSAITCITLGTFPIFVQMAAGVMTEPLFIFLFFLSVFLLLGYLKHKSSRWLILSGIITGLLSITRYTGLVCILSGIVTIVIFTEAKKLMRFKSAVIFGLLGFLPLSIFGISVLLFANSSAHVGISGFNGSMMISRFKEIIIDTTQLIWKWVPFHTYIGELKLRYQILIILVILIMIVLITYLANQRSKKKKESPAIHQEYSLFFIFGINGVGFVVFLIFTYVFHTLRMDDRQLLPVFLNCALSIICATALLINVWLISTKFWKAIPVWGIVLLLLFSVYPQYSNSINILNMDQGLMASSWRYSETVRALRQIPPNIPIVSNNAAALLYWADRPAYEMFDSLTANFVGETTPYGSDDTDRAQKAFHDSKGILVIFTNFPKQMSSSFSERGYSRLSTIFSGLFLQGKYDDGTIYNLAPDTIH